MADTVLKVLVQDQPVSLYTTSRITAVWMGASWSTTIPLHFVVTDGDLFRSKPVAIYVLLIKNIMGRLVLDCNYKV